MVVSGMSAAEEDVLSALVDLSIPTWRRRKPWSLLKGGAAISFDKIFREVLNRLSKWPTFSNGQGAVGTL
jgi:hypothetical protein